MKPSRKKPDIITIPVTGNRARLREILKAFTEACHAVRELAAKHDCSTPAGLQVLAYRKLSPKRNPEGLPSQYSVRAINRVAHQLRLQRLSLPDPYPAHSFDLDARTCSLDPLKGQLTITTLDSRFLRGGAARGHRLALGPLTPEILRALAAGRFLGGHLVVPSKGPMTLLARFLPEQPPRGEKAAPPSKVLKPRASG